MQEKAKNKAKTKISSLTCAQHNKAKTAARVLVICAAALIVLAAAAGFIFSRRYVRLGQQFIPVSAATLDLRGAGISDLSALDRCTELTELDVRENDLSADALDAFRAAHPGCRVLYSVYLNGEPYDSAEESVTLEDLPNDWVNIRLFENQCLIFHNLCALWNVGYQTAVAVAHCLQKAQRHSLQIRWKSVDVCVAEQFLQHLSLHKSGENNPIIALCKLF